MSCPAAFHFATRRATFLIRSTEPTEVPPNFWTMSATWLKKQRFYTPPILSRVRTVVFQSYRTEDVPAWIARCMESVRAWAAANGFEYRFYDDGFLARAPSWYREKARNNVLLVSDLARLLVARELLGEGCERTIWMDADLLFFDPRPARFDVADGYAFCREIWSWRKDDGSAWLLPERANNAVSVFDGGNPVLDFLAYAAQAMVRNTPGEVPPTAVSTTLLTGLKESIGLPLLRNIGTLSPYAMVALLKGEAAYLQPFMAAVGEPLLAANLCGSFRDAANHGITLDEPVYEAAVRLLLESKGAALNKFLGPR